LCFVGTRSIEMCQHYNAVTFGQGICTYLSSEHDLLYEYCNIAFCLLNTYKISRVGKFIPALVALSGTLATYTGGHDSDGNTSFSLIVL
jgi:hypothetical protein